LIFCFAELNYLYSKEEAAVAYFDQNKEKTSLRLE
jgi:hypothetical protein